MAKDPEVIALAGVVYQEILAGLITSTTVKAHQEIKRSRVQCGICRTRCRVHNPLHPIASSSTLSVSRSESVPPTRTSSPAPQIGSATSSFDGRMGVVSGGSDKSNGGATGVGSGSGRIDSSGNAFFDCLVCGRATTSSRYAPHLASCLGFNGSTRRGAARSAAAKARLGTNDRSSPSPYLQSENGDSDADSVAGKKAKSINANGKRGRSPSKPLPNFTKKSRMGSPTPSTGAPSFSKLPPSKLSQPIDMRSPESDVATEYSGSQSQQGGFSAKKRLPGMPTGSLAGSVTGSVEGDPSVAVDLTGGYESSDAGDDY